LRPFFFWQNTSAQKSKAGHATCQNAQRFVT